MVRSRDYVFPVLLGDDENTFKAMLSHGFRVLKLMSKKHKQFFVRRGVWPDVMQTVYAAVIEYRRLHSSMQIFPNQKVKKAVYKDLMRHIGREVYRVIRDLIPDYRRIGGAYVEVVPDDIVAFQATSLWASYGFDLEPTKDGRVVVAVKPEGRGGCKGLRIGDKIENAYHLPGSDPILIVRRGTDLKQIYTAER